MPGQKPIAPIAIEADLEEATQRQGRALLAELRKRDRHKSVQSAVFDWLLAETTANADLKTQLFRFVDTLPSLHSRHAVASHLAEYLSEPQVELPAVATRLLGLLRRGSLLDMPVAAAAGAGTRLMAHHFIAGEDARSALGHIRRLRRRGLGFSIDVLGEAVVSEQEADAYLSQYLKLIDDLADAAADWPVNELTDSAPFGPVPKVNLSVKLTALYSRFDSMAADSTIENVKQRLRPLLRHARERGVFVNFDMEQNEHRSITYRIFREVLVEDEFKDWSDVGIVVQAYLRSAKSDLNALLDWAIGRGAPVWIRLVKGAYWDYETIVAAERGQPQPVFSEKTETDANYEKLTEVLLQNWQTLHPAIATHNVRSAAHALAVAETLKLPRGAVEFQVLFGMGEAFGSALADSGQRVRVYVPCGELLPGMAYLVRRLLENSANDSFIHRFEDKVTTDDQLLRPPLPATNQQSAKTNSPGEPNGFRNEPQIDFSIDENRAAMQRALADVTAIFGQVVPVVIKGKHEFSDSPQPRANPSRTDQIVSRISWATAEQAERALQTAVIVFESWRDAPVPQRSTLLRGVAAEYRRRRFEIAAWQVYEAGKPWRDAVADVAEAIDFCEYYALEMERLSQPHHSDVPGEWNDYIYDARGPAIIIAPWNFPLAILTGMAVAALVAGNPIIVKPAEQSSRIGYFLMEALEAAGSPPGVAQFLPGQGELLGPLLVDDPRTALVAFTGSNKVGLEILSGAAEVKPGQREIKRVVAELGGKNAIVIDEDADLDEAVAGCLASFVGYAGQKCSACSRIVVVGSAYAPFCRRLAAAIESIDIAPAENPSATLGPLIDDDAQRRVLGAIEQGRREATLLAQCTPPPVLAEIGYFVPVAAFTDYPQDGSLWRDEIFGPVVIIRQAADLTEAFALALDSRYSLTGGFYSRSPRAIERARRELRVGNLYINRGITGALVGRQPFGGRGMSGVGSKAGGPDYLQQFLVPRSVTESVMRHGFAPDKGETGR